MIPGGLEASIALLRHGESVFITEGRFQGQADSPLSPLGERQALLAGRRLAAPHRSPALPLPMGPPLEIVHSPLMRTTQTAAASAAAIGEASGSCPPLRPDPDLVETGQGEWEGLRRHEVETGWPDLLAAWRATPTAAQAPGGERLFEVRERAAAVLHRTLERLAAQSGVSAQAGLAAPTAPPGVAAPTAPPGAPPRTSPASAGYPGTLSPESPWSILVGHDGIFKVLFLTLFDLPLERFWSFPFALCGITIVEIRAGRPVLRVHNSTEHLAPLLDERAQEITEEREQAGQL
jgi:probable phosphoglycerate mutase